MSFKKVLILALFLGLFIAPALSLAATWTDYGSCPSIASAPTCGSLLYRTKTCSGTNCPTASVRYQVCGYAPCPLDKNSAEFVEIIGAPSTPNLTPGQEFVLTVKVKNTSDIAWPKQSLFNLTKRAYGYRLAFVDVNSDIDADGYADYTNVWDPSSSLTLNQNTATGSIATFSKRIKAPNRAGTYTLTLQMYQQNRGLFGPKSETKTYTVVGAADSKSIGSVDISNFNEAVDVWVRGINKAVEWVTTGNINRVKISICPVGADTCTPAKHNNTTLNNVLNDDYSLVTIPSNSTYTQASIKVEDKTNAERFSLSPIFTVGSGNNNVSANPSLNSYTDWDIKTETKVLRWDPKAFSSSFVEIWMCPSTVTPSASACIKSYGGTDAPNVGSKGVGLPVGVTPGSWRVFITGTTGGTVGSGLTPEVKLVDGSIINPLVVLSNPTFTDNSDWNIVGQTKTLKWTAMAFNSGTGNVDIWMCKDGSDFSATNGNCLNSYAGVPNAGERQIGLPGNISTGYWRIYVKASTGDNAGAGFTPRVKLVSSAAATVYGSLRAASNQPNAGQIRIGSTDGNGWTSDYTHPEMNDTVCPGGTCTVSFKTVNTAYRFVANDYTQNCTGDANTGVRICTFPRTTSNISIFGTWELIPVAATGPTWTAVGSCSVTCGGGTQTWTCAGTACPRAREVRSCNTQACPATQTPTLVVNAVGSGGEVILPDRNGGIVIEVANAFTGCSISSKTTGSTPIPVSGSFTLPGTYSGHYFPKNAPGGAVDTDNVTLSCPNYSPKTVTVRVKPTIQPNSFSAARRGDEILYKWKTTSGVKANAPDGSLTCTISQNNKYYEGRPLGLSNYTTATLNNVSNNQGGSEDKEQQKRVTGPCQSGIGGGHAVINQACQIDASIICTSTNGLSTDRAYAQYNMDLSNTY